MPALQSFGIEANADCCENSCEKSENQNEHEENRQEGCNEICNPFLACHCCIGFVASKENFTVSVTNEYGLQSSSYREATLSEVLYPVWEPPKI